MNLCNTCKKTHQQYGGNVIEDLEEAEFVLKTFRGDDNTLAKFLEALRGEAVKNEGLQKGLEKFTSFF